jgi:hypothetical protein
MPLAHRWLAREIPPDLIADLFENIWELQTKLFGIIFPKIGSVKSIMSFFWYNIPKIDMELVAAFAVFRYITRRHHHDEAIMVVFSAGEAWGGRRSSKKDTSMLDA